jgi:hypothetical protein
VLTIRSLAAGVLVAAALTTPAHAAPSRAEIALRWAPIHYQDVDTTGSHALAGKSDYITRYDFDGNLNGRDNWDNTGTNTDAAVYYSVLETSTHYYLTYLFFHPRDWIDHPFFETEHENDGEGVLEIVEKDGSEYGSLKAAVTVAHSDFFSYKPAAADGPAAARPSTAPCSCSRRRTTRSSTRSPPRSAAGTGSRRGRSTTSTATASSTTRR